MKRLVIAFIIFTQAMFAQQQSKDSPPTQYIQTSGQVLTFANAPGSGTITLEYLFTGVSAPTITVQGCAQGGTCTTLTALSGTNPYTTATNAMVQFAGGYFSYTVTATYTGTGAITVNFVGIQAKSGSGGGGGATTFDQIGSGTNTTHGLVVGTGSVLTTADTGIINANELNGTLLSGLATGSLCNTTGTGVPTVGCAVTLSQLPSAAQRAAAYFAPTNQEYYAFFGAGDSYKFGAGAQTRGTSYFALQSNDVPTIVPPLNVAVSGTFTSDIVKSVLANWMPSPSIPSVATIDGGNNDYTFDTTTTCGQTTTSNCITNYKNELNAAIAWMAIPQQFRTMSSLATTTGGFAADTTIPLTTFNGTTTNGLAVHSNGTGAALVFTIPAANNGKFGVISGNVNGQTGTYTVNISGAGGGLQTDICSGTTTFSSGGCNGQAMPTSPSVQRQEFTVPAGVARTVTVTATNAVAFIIEGVDYQPTTLPANASYVYVDNSGAAFDINGSYSTASAAVVSTFAADGLFVYPVDIRAALLAQPGNGISGTASAANGPATTAVNHPNDYGQRAEYNAWLAEQASSTVSVSRTNSGGQQTANNGIIYGPITTYVGTQTSLTIPQLFNHLNPMGTVGAGYLLNESGNNYVGGRLGRATVTDGTASAFYQGLFGPAGLPYLCMEPTSATPQTASTWVPMWCVKYATGDTNQKGAATATQFNPTAAQTTVTCSTSGNVVFSQPSAGASDKKILIQENACLGTASYTYPTAFTVTPTAYGTLTNASAISTTAVTVTQAVTAATGGMFLEAY